MARKKNKISKRQRIDRIAERGWIGKEEKMGNKERIVWLRVHMHYANCRGSISSG